MPEVLAETKPISIQPRWRRKLLRALGLYVLLPYLAVTLIFAVLQRRLMYRPTVAADLSLDRVNLKENSNLDVEISVDDETTIRGWLLRSTRPDMSAPLVLYFPGNSLNRHERREDLLECCRNGFDLLTFDYRGFGDSDGSPSEEKLTADAARVWKYATEILGYEQERIVIFGESLGGAVALSLWKVGGPNVRPAALILSSTFASMEEVVTDHYPLFPFRYLLIDDWPSRQRIGQVDCPITIYHGTKDDMIPIEQGRTLAELAANAEFIEIKGGEHNEIPTFPLRKKFKSLAIKL